MKLMRLMTMLLILILASSPVLASVCSVSCALDQASHLQQGKFEIAMPSMDTGHCEHMQQSQPVQHSNTQDSSQQHNHCSMAGCHFSIAATLELCKQDFMLNIPEHQLLHFNDFRRSAEIPPPIKPPA